MPFLAPLIPLVIGAGASALSKGGGSAPPAPGGAAMDQKNNDFSWGQNAGGAGWQPNDPNHNPLVGGGGAGQAVHRNSGAEDATQRYQGLGTAAGNHAAPTADWGQSDQSRGQQEDALGMMKGAAQGNAPSAAAQMMNQGNDQAIANQMSMAAGARGAGAMAGAQQNAAGNASALSTQNNNNTGILRAQEMAQARGQYGQMASGMRGQDEGRQQYLGGLQEQQNALNQQGQMGYEGMGYNVNNAQLGAGMGRQGFNQDAWKAQMATDQHGIDRNTGLAMEGGKAVLGAISGAASASDERVKDGIQDLGTPDRSTSQNVDGSRFSRGPSMGDRASAGMQGAASAKPRAQMGDLDYGSTHRQIPMPPPMAMSDAHAKEQAYELGMHAGRQMGLEGTHIGGNEQGPRQDTWGRTAPQQAADAPHEEGWRAQLDKDMRVPTRSQVTADGRDHGNDYEVPDAANPPRGTVFDSSAAVTKTNPHSQLDEAYAAMPPKSFSYKPGVPGTQPGVQQAGIIAQDAERHPLTAAMVRETPHGKAIDLGTAASLSLATGGEHSQRLQALEAHLGMRRPQMGGRR